MLQAARLSSSASRTARRVKMPMILALRWVELLEAHAARLEELDINPLLVLPEGQGAVAVDALIRMREERQE